MLKPEILLTEVKKDLNLALSILKKKSSHILAEVNNNEY
jgi:hypothetical protein